MIVTMKFENNDKVVADLIDISKSKKYDKEICY